MGSPEKIRQREVEVEIVVDVAKGHAHAGLAAPVHRERDAGRIGDIREHTPPVVEQQQVRHAVVGDVHVSWSPSPSKSKFASASVYPGTWLGNAFALASNNVPSPAPR